MNNPDRMLILSDKILGCIRSFAPGCQIGLKNSSRVNILDIHSGGLMSLGSNAQCFPQDVPGNY